MTRLNFIIISQSDSHMQLIYFVVNEILNAYNIYLIKLIL